MTSLTLDLGRFVAELSFRQIPSEGCDIARTGIADCFGVLVAGSRDRKIALIDRELGSTHGALASLIPSGARRSIETAALVNGVAAHVLDYDDVGLGPPERGPRPSDHCPRGSKRSERRRNVDGIYRRLRGMGRTPGA